MSEPAQEIGIGDFVRILGAQVKGFVTAFTCSLRREDSYLVEYVDADGNPQEREWSESQLSLVEKAKAEAEDWFETNEPDNVVPLRRAN
ncbi:hypothetical protein [Devosia elaeis]|uniref:Uncharacterized protein n=1 Tax=Devosia elaeis TaxID=1770058 RepID=A0A178HZE0_9HYPH|nr:hypothetical protein [Devosia elaeis]OAM78201.1 hypothetical protein A3840_06770 [Devosia elaeis]